MGNKANFEYNPRYDKAVIKEEMSPISRFWYTKHIRAHRIFHLISYLLFFIVHLLCYIFEVYRPTTITWVNFAFVSFFFFLLVVAVYECGVSTLFAHFSANVTLYYCDLITLIAIYCYEIYNVYRIIESLQ